MNASSAPLVARLGYAFRDPALLELALTHPSLVAERPDRESNQRLEFLGDAVLQLILSEALFQLYPQEREGELSRRRSTLSRGEFLAALAREISLDQALLLAAAEESTGGRQRPAALEDAFEALIGALYLDGGYAVARDRVLSIYGDLGARVAGMEGAFNPKGRLQERVQPLHGNDALRYEVTQVDGVEHAREYEVTVFLLGQPVGVGRGGSKKLAEEAAARAALVAV